MIDVETVAILVKLIQRLAFTYLMLMVAVHICIRLALEVTRRLIFTPHIFESLNSIWDVCFTATSDDNLRAVALKMIEMSTIRMIIRREHILLS